MKMSKKSKILSGVAACVLLAAAIGCAVFFLTKGKSKPSAASDGVEVTRSYFRSHAVYNGDFRSELTEDELFFYDLFYKQCQSLKERHENQGHEINIKFKILSY